MNRNHRQTTVRNGLRRGFTALLCLAMLLGLVPGLELSAQAADSWATPYLNQLVGWGVMRGDIHGNLYPERNITRAEFVTMMNRAYGYNETGGNPFTDVFVSDWYYDDVDIAYNVGYFTGTSATTASPKAELTREQAAVLLARNMMLQGTSGEALGFSDSRELSDWSRGLVGAVAQAGVISGYGDGSFRPKNSITRGEVAAMLARAVGSLISQPGDQSLGSVYGNLTINSSGVSLRNTTIVGNLYLTGGIGLGDVLLENVDVYGEIVVAGAGEANSSRSSVIMRNVTANELIVDNISNQFVTVRAEGDTRIAKTSVRTNAYVEDTTPNGYGLSLIELNGEPGTRLQVAGNIKEVKNLTPQSSLEIVQGTAAKVTSDEHATGSAVRIEAGARVDELNLDVGASVSGDGDIGSMNVGAAGTNVGILPDNITVRPGITSNITGTAMNNVTAAESSADPRLLSGYPAVRNVAPNSATLVFSTNKAGTVYWAVSALADGSVNEDDLITNPAYGGNIFRSGRINAQNSKTEYTAQVSGLTIDGSYYVSAILVDSRGNHSPLKVTAFSTPDNTTPAFTTGYPTMTKNTTKTAQVTVMTNKSCQMYYALLPRGSSTPTAQEFKSGAVSGNLGYGVVDVVKNNTQPVNVNSVQLEELTNYTLYLWLNDYDNARSSGVRSLQFTTPDETPPVVTDISSLGTSATAASVNYSLNEPGTLYWAIVAEGNTTYMTDDLGSTRAKVKVEAGAGAIRNGFSRASRADTDIRVAIAGLNSATTGTSSYDLYYVAKDSAGNYSETVGKINVRTLDTDRPTVTQEFTRYNENNDKEPLADTDIRLVFSESVQGGSDGKNRFLELFEAISGSTDEKIAAREKLAKSLHDYIKLYYRTATGGVSEVPYRIDSDYKDTDSWTIDYRYAQVTMEDGKMVIIFPTTGQDRDRNVIHALNLDSGETYWFELTDIYDNASQPNAMRPNPNKLPEFTTEFARVTLILGETTLIEEKDLEQGETLGSGSSDNPASRMDFSFIVNPLSVDRAPDSKRRDMLIWSNLNLTYTIYEREVDERGTPVSDWKRLNDKPILINSGETERYSSFTQDILTTDPDKKQSPTFEKLNDKTWKPTEYAIHIDTIGSNPNFRAWNYNLTLKVQVVAGDSNSLGLLLGTKDQTAYNTAAAAGMKLISTPEPFPLRKSFSDLDAPQISSPSIVVRDTSAQIGLMLNKEGTVYYVAAPILTLTWLDGESTRNLANNDLKGVTSFNPSVAVSGGSLNGKDIPTNSDGQPILASIPEYGRLATNKFNPASPTHLDIRDKTYDSRDRKGNTGRRGANVSTMINLENLQPNTVYLLFLSTEGLSGIYSDEGVLCYRFTTLEPIRPTIELTDYGSGAVDVDIKKADSADLNYFMVQSSAVDRKFTDEMFFKKDANDATKIVAGTPVDTGIYNNDKSKYTFNGSEDEMNVLTAMATKCYTKSGNDYVGTVFDVFANETAKNEYATLIQRQSSNTSSGVLSGSLSWPRANQISYDSNKISVGMEYTLFTVGRGAEGSGFAFCAYYPVRKSDASPPMVIAASPSGDIDDKGKFTGTIEVTFNERLYYQHYCPNLEVIPLDTCALGQNHSTFGTSTMSSIGIGYIAKPSANTLTLSTNSQSGQGLSGHGANVSVSFVTINCKNASNGAQVTFLGGLCDAKGNTHSRGEAMIPLVVTLVIEKDRSGEYTCRCNVTQAWDGR